MEKKLLLFLVSIVLIITMSTLLINSLFDKSIGVSFFFSTLLVLIILMIWFIQWAYQPMSPTENINSILSENDLILTKNRYGYILKMKNKSKNQGIIFYPGGRVAPLAYTPLLKIIANHGYPVYLVKMPFNMAVFDYQRAKKIINEQETVSSWIIGGHSLGGAMAVHVTKKMPALFKGLFLWGAYPSRRDDLSNLELPILSIFGNCDGITTVEKIKNSYSLFPKHTQWIELDGANHAQFGCYGVEKKDQKATITPQTQQQKVTEATLTFINKIV